MDKLQTRERQPSDFFIFYLKPTTDITTISLSLSTKKFIAVRLKKQSTGQKALGGRFRNDSIDNRNKILILTTVEGQKLLLTVLG
jgi:hypothetical protein